MHSTGGSRVGKSRTGQDIGLRKVKIVINTMVFRLLLLLSSSVVLDSLPVPFISLLALVTVSFLFWNQWPCTSLTCPELLSAPQASLTCASQRGRKALIFNIEKLVCFSVASQMAAL